MGKVTNRPGPGQSRGQGVGWEGQGKRPSEGTGWDEPWPSGTHGHGLPAASLSEWAPREHRPGGGQTGHHKLVSPYCSPSHPLPRNLPDKRKLLLTYLPGTPQQGFWILKTAKTFEWLHMKCCPASFCLKDSSCPSPSPPPNIPPNDFRAKIRGGPRPWGAPRHEGLLQRCQGTGRVRCSRGPGSTAQSPGLSSYRFYLFRERACIRFPDKVTSSFAFLSSFFLAASSRCFRMIASGAR